VLSQHLVVLDGLLGMVQSVSVAALLGELDTEAMQGSSQIRQAPLAAVLDQGAVVPDSFVEVVRASSRRPA